MAKMLVGAAATAVMIVGGFTDPERRYVYLLFTFFGVLGTFRAWVAWEKKRREAPGGTV